MLRSFHYAAYAALFAFAQSPRGASPSGWCHGPTRGSTGCHARSSPRTGRHWRHTPVASGAPQSFDALLQALMLDKALYELRYEFNNRPEWARIPLTALAMLASPLQR